MEITFNIVISTVITFIEILKSSRILKNNNYGVMKEGEVRTFVIEKSQKPKCKLSAKDDKITIEIKKEKLPKEQYQYIMTPASSEDKKTALIFEAGSVDNVDVAEPAQECGIAKIFMLLFLNENEMNDIKNAKNKAMGSIERDKKPMARVYEEWIKEKCQFLIYLNMVAKDKTKAHLYFNSAIDSEYTMMFIKQGFNKGYWPENGSCPTENLKGRYRDDGYIMGEDGSDAGKINAWGTLWYFCKPQKTTPTDSKCTDLKKL